MKPLQRKIGYFILSLVFLYSCGGYYKKITVFNELLQQGQYAEAQDNLSKIKFLKKKKNKLLYNLEMGKMAHLNKDYTASNAFLNEADNLMDEKNNAGNIAVGMTLNPSEMPYRGEDFEKVLIHYYKALNYLYLGKQEDAIVEARQINLKLNNLNDKYKDKANKYSHDTFSLILQGIIYETGGDFNNAFISYRNAFEVYEKDSTHLYFGTALPMQLKKDLLRTAALSGFWNDVEFYEKQFGMKYEKTSFKNGELIVFFENGLAPYKQQKDYFFTLNKNSGDAMYTFSDESGLINIPFSGGSGNETDDSKFTDLGIFHVAFPKYIERPLLYTNCTLVIDSAHTNTMELVEDINNIAFETLQDRFWREMGTALARLAVKKTLEKQLKKENEVAGSLLGLANAITEKADTRNWQTLPHSIYYARIPLNEGTNQLSLVLKDIYDNNDTLSFTTVANGKLQVLNLANLKQANDWGSIKIYH